MSRFAKLSQDIEEIFDNLGNDVDAVDSIECYVFSMINHVMESEDIGSVDTGFICELTDDLARGLGVKEW